MTEREKMLAGLNYDPGDPELVAARARAVDLTMRINQEPAPAKRRALFNELVHAADGRAAIMPGFFGDYGDNIRLGARAFVNANCVFLDCGNITIGDEVMLGPKVAIYAVNHPIDPVVRSTHYDYPVPVTIGSNVWIGGSVVICPGVTIGDNTVIGAGSVVTRDIPSGVVAAGNPCRVIRTITQEESDYWKHQLELTHQLLKASD